MESGLEVVNMSFEFFWDLTSIQNNLFIVQINDFEIKMTIKERKLWVKSYFFFHSKCLLNLLLNK